MPNIHNPQRNQDLLKAQKIAQASIDAESIDTSRRGREVDKTPKPSSKKKRLM